eukprot:1314782-Amphidinium_carterae.1
MWVVPTSCLRRERQNLSEKARVAMVSSSLIHSVQDNGMKAGRPRFYRDQTIDPHIPEVATAIVLWSSINKNMQYV